MSYGDPYFRSKFPSKIVRKKKPNPYKRYTGGYACHRCNEVHDAAYLIPAGEFGGMNSLVCENCVPLFL